MPLDDLYLDTLAESIIEQWQANPPALAAVGKVKVGRLQESPEDNPAVITLHIGDPDQDSYIPKEMLTDQTGSTEGRRHQAWGGYTEVGGGSFYWYRYTAKIQYFFTRTGEDQDTARRLHDDLVRWLSRRIRSQSGLSVDGETLISSQVLDVRALEGGGPPNSYIWTSRLHIQGLVYVE